MHLAFALSSDASVFLLILLRVPILLLTATASLARRKSEKASLQCIQEGGRA